MRSAVEDAGLDYMGAFLPVTARRVRPRDADPLRHEEPRSRPGPAYDVAGRLVREAARHGYGEYRAHLDFMDVAAVEYSLE